MGLQVKSRDMVTILEGVEDRMEALKSPLFRNRECVVCMDQKKRVDFEWTGHVATHAICHHCMQQYLWGKIVEDKVTSIKCPGSECKLDLTYEEIKHHAAPFTFERYISAQTFWQRGLEIVTINFFFSDLVKRIQISSHAPIQNVARVKWSPISVSSSI